MNRSLLPAEVTGLPSPVAHIREEAEKAAVHWSVKRVRHELRKLQTGGVLVAQHFASVDRQVGAAIGAMHASPRTAQRCGGWQDAPACRGRASP